MHLDTRLEESSTFVKDLKLCQVRISHNSKFPWVLLIPKKDVTEIIDLEAPDQMLLMDEISITSRVMKELFKPDKLNVAALGNVVPQLHVHVIARYRHDEAWPNPVWNSGVQGDYEEEQLKDRISKLWAAYDVYKS